VTGQAEARLSVAGQVDAAGVWQAILADFPALDCYRDSVRLACNGEYAGPGARFADADEVALIPPVSGG
jgi:molybdopterin converting factor small subunit